MRELVGRWSHVIPHRPHLALIRRVLAPVPDHWYLALGHLAYFHSWPNYREPRTFNEHIQAYMLRSRNPLLKVAADKLAMREYIAREVGSEYLVPLLGVWLDASDVPLEKLPVPCVIKASVGSGMVLMVHDRDAATIKHCRKQMERWLKRDYSKLHREWAYENLPRRIIAEP
ncbi:MAG TPA: ATP-grasp fold amidoligase family protein, partial [Burkholderiaceae bacterium]|nr:ATP-grasp fold amidoligase family protein [Burkholderiaceae bacterium]